MLTRTLMPAGMVRPGTSGLSPFRAAGSNSLSRSRRTWGHFGLGGVHLIRRRFSAPQAVVSPKTKESDDSLVDAGSNGRDTSATPLVVAPVSHAPSTNDNQPNGFKSAANIVYRRILKELSSFPKAIGVLGLISICCAIGTIVEQNKGLEWYMENYPEIGEKLFGFLTYKWIYTLQWDHIYTCWYFLGLMGLLAAQLMACTYTRQFPLVKVAQRWRFLSTPEALAKLGSAETLPDANINDFGPLLEQKGYKVFMKDGDLYAFKGLVGRFAPIGVHISMLLIMAGVVYGGFGGYKGTAMVPEGQGFVIEQALRPNSLVSQQPDAARQVLRVNEFDIAYRSDGGVSQFYSDLSVEDQEGNEMKRKKISVNDPLRYGGVTMYQTDWSMAALSVIAKGSPLQREAGEFVNLPMALLEGRKESSGRVWATFIPLPETTMDGPPRGVSVLAKDFQTVILYDSHGQFAGVRRPGSGKPITIDGMEITIGEIIGSTGLEIKADPGVPYVYAGFAGLMLTTLLSYLSHSQIWACQRGRDLHVAGKTNRAKVVFDIELSELLDKVPEVVRVEPPTS